MATPWNVRRVVKYLRLWLAQGWEGQWLHLHQEYEGKVFFFAFVLSSTKRVLKTRALGLSSFLKQFHTYGNVVVGHNNKFETVLQKGPIVIIGLPLPLHGGRGQRSGAGARLGTWESYLLPRQAKDRPPGKQRTVPQASKGPSPQASKGPSPKIELRRQ